MSFVAENLCHFQTSRVDIVVDADGVSIGIQLVATCDSGGTIFMTFMSSSSTSNGLSNIDTAPNLFA